MKKYLGISLLLLMLSILVSVKHQEYADESASNGGEQSLAVSSANTPTAKDNSQKPKENLHPRWDQAYIIIGWPNGITVWALLLTMAVIAEQTMETRKAAEASLRQIGTMKDQERARLTVLVPEDLDFASPTRLVFKGHRQFWMGIEIPVANDGRSKAFNVKAWGRMTIEKTTEGVTLLNSGNALEVPKVIRECSPESPIKIRLTQWLLEDDESAIQNASAFLFVYGEIVYEDVFGDKHITPFRYRWETHYPGPDEGWEGDYEWIDESGPST